MRLMILVLALCGCAEAQVEPHQVGRGGQWLSWNAEQRTSYVKGFVDGHLGGFLRACNAADELFEVGEPHRLGDGDDPGEVPSARCLARRGEFAKVRLQEGGEMDVSAYTDVITAFYEEHGRCRDFPFALLLGVLSSEYLSADQLYESAITGKLKGLEVRSRGWCGG